jgi:hypothetical protein
MSTKSKLLVSAEITLALFAGIVAFIAPVWVAISLLTAAVCLAPDIRSERD